MTAPNPSPHEIRVALKRYICEEILKDPQYPIGDDTRLITGGIIASFNITHISVFMENEFNALINDENLNPENMDTISGMALLVENALSSGADSQ